MKCYRFFNKSENGKIQSGYDGSLWVIGEWRKIAGEIVPCENGFHACKKPIDSLNNIYGNTFFLCEARGKILSKGDKFASSEMRIIREIPEIVLHKALITFAKKVLPIFKKKYPKDNRPRMAITAAKDFLAGKITEEELAAAGAAAWDAWAAAWDAGAATGAAWAAGAATGAAKAAWDAWAAAWDAGAATGAAKAAWAAGAATGAAKAAWAAGAATGAAKAAWDAWAAAWDAGAAGAAMREWQNNTLMRLIRTFRK